MAKSYDLHQIGLLDVQKSLERNLKKGDLINVGIENLPQIKQILERNNIEFTVAEFELGLNQVTIN